MKTPSKRLRRLSVELDWCLRPEEREKTSEFFQKRRPQVEMIFFIETQGAHTLSIKAHVKCNPRDIAAADEEMAGLEPALQMIGIVPLYHARTTGGDPEDLYREWCFIIANGVVKPTNELSLLTFVGKLCKALTLPLPTSIDPCLRHSVWIHSPAIGKMIWLPKSFYLAEKLKRMLA
jgi:hypothetical protein